MRNVLSRARKLALRQSVQRGSAARPPCDYLAAPAGVVAWHYLFAVASIITVSSAARLARAGKVRKKCGKNVFCITCRNDVCMLQKCFLHTRPAPRRKPLRGPAQGHALRAKARPAADPHGLRPDALRARTATPCGRIVPRNQEPVPSLVWLVDLRQSCTAIKLVAGSALARTVLSLRLAHVSPASAPVLRLCSCSCPGSVSALLCTAGDRAAQGPRAPAGAWGKGGSKGRHGPPISWAKAPRSLGRTHYASLRVCSKPRRASL